MSLLDKENNNDHVDIHTIIAKTLYLGMFTNVMMPGALLFLCYYINENYQISNKVGTMGDNLFFVFALIATAQAAYAYWKKNNDIRKPMAIKAGSFEEDLSFGILKIFRSIFIIVGAISLYGYLYFFLTGRFKESMLLVLLSFIVFQIIRPRYGAVEKMIKHQRAFLGREE